MGAERVASTTRAGTDGGLGGGVWCARKRKSRSWSSLWPWHRAVQGGCGGGQYARLDRPGFRTGSLDDRQVRGFVCEGAEKAGGRGGGRSDREVDRLEEG